MTRLVSLLALALSVAAVETDLPSEFTDIDNHHLVFDLNLRKEWYSENPTMDY